MFFKKLILSLSFFSLLFLILFIPINFNFIPPYFSLINKKYLIEPVQTLFALNLGLRKQMSELLFIQLMQYYGSLETNNLDNDKDYGTGNYPLFYSYTENILALNPYYKDVVLYSSASLAFNLNRPYQAISILKTALFYSKDWDYYKMLGVISQKDIKNNKDIAENLYLIAIKEDSPVMIKQIAAFLNKKANKINNALKLYELILKTTKDIRYIENAKKNIEFILNNENINN